MFDFLFRKPVSKITPQEVFDAYVRKDDSFVKSYLRRGGNPNIQDENGLTLVHWAVKTMNLTLLKKLKQAGANPNILCARGLAPLHVAVKNSNPHEFFIIEELCSFENIDLSVRSRHPSQEGFTPLHFAALHANRKFVFFAVFNAPPSKKPYIDSLDDKCYPPLFYAVSCSQDHHFVGLLLECGANINFKAPDGETVLSILAKKPELLKNGKMIQKLFSMDVDENQPVGGYKNLFEYAKANYLDDTIRFLEPYYDGYEEVTSNMPSIQDLIDEARKEEAERLKRVQNGEIEISFPSYDSACSGAVQVVAGEGMHYSEPFFEQQTHIFAQEPLKPVTSTQQMWQRVAHEVQIPAVQMQKEGASVSASSLPAEVSEQVENFANSARTDSGFENSAGDERISRNPKNASGVVQHSTQNMWQNILKNQMDNRQKS